MDNVSQRFQLITVEAACTYVLYHLPLSVLDFFELFIKLPSLCQCSILKLFKAILPLLVIYFSVSNLHLSVLNFNKKIWMLHHHCHKFLSNNPQDQKIYDFASLIWRLIFWFSSPK